MAKHRQEDRERGLTGETDPQKIKSTADRIDRQEAARADQIRHGTDKK